MAKFTEIIVKTIDVESGSYLSINDEIKNIAPLDIYLVPKSDGTHDRYVLDQLGVISKQSTGSGGAEGDFIPLTGTEIDKPITGNVVLDFTGEEGFNIDKISLSQYVGFTHEKSSYIASLSGYGGLYVGMVGSPDHYIQANFNDGIFSNRYFEPINDFHYVQKKYVDDNAGIPLTGTEVDKPLTGTINFIGGNFVQTTVDYPFKEGQVNNGINIGNGIILSHIDVDNPSIANYIVVREEGVQFQLSRAGQQTANINFTNLERGLSSDYDYTANIQELDYVQKKYVDDKLATTKTSYDINQTISDGSIIGKVDVYKNLDLFTLVFDAAINVTNPDPSTNIDIKFTILEDMVENIQPFNKAFLVPVFTYIGASTEGSTVVRIKKTQGQSGLVVSLGLIILESGGGAETTITIPSFKEVLTIQST